MNRFLNSSFKDNRFLCIGNAYFKKDKVKKVALRPCRDVTVIQQKPEYFLGLKNGSSYSYK